MIDKYLLDELRLRNDEKGELARWVIQLQTDLDTERRKTASLDSALCKSNERIAELERGQQKPAGYIDARCFEGKYPTGGSWSLQPHDIGGLNQVTPFYLSPATALRQSDHLTRAISLAAEMKELAERIRAEEQALPSPAVPSHEEIFGIIHRYAPSTTHWDTGWIHVAANACLATMRPSDPKSD